VTEGLERLLAWLTNRGTAACPVWRSPGGWRHEVALVNPRWTFDGGIYFGCREPHLPLEYGYARALLERAGHEVLLVDAQLHDLSPGRWRGA
jgi:hypothetical protein